MDRYGILARFAEPSTWAGIAGLVGLFVPHLPIPQVQAVATIGTTIASALAILIPEVGKRLQQQTAAPAGQ